jgi:hypothetical protein
MISERTGILRARSACITAYSAVALIASFAAPLRMLASDRACACAASGRCPRIALAIWN